MKTIIAATIVATGFIVAGYLVRQPSQIIIERNVETKEFRYQFIPNEFYGREKVFDRKTGVVYCFGKNDDERACACDYKTGTMYWKSWDIGEWDEAFIRRNAGEAK